jgi:hypothetical protein
MKEARIESGDSKRFAKEQQKKYGWMAYRSTKICIESFKLMDGYVDDFRIAEIVNGCEKLIEKIDSKLLSQ